MNTNAFSMNMLVLDGEFYNPNINFEKLIGFVRNENDKDVKDIQFYMFDSFIYKLDFSEKSNSEKVDIVKEPFEKRLERNINLFKNIPTTLFKFVETKIVNNEDEILVSLDNYIKDKYEGIIIRSKNGLYESSTNREIRSYQALKLKKFIDAEYPIKGITDGNKGKEIGAIKYILGLPDGNVFNATPNMTLNKRRELFVKYSNKKEFEKIKDKMVTVRYQELTDNGVPRFAKVIAVRDYE
jgi:DNA ligase-1